MDSSKLSKIKYIAVNVCVHTYLKVLSISKKAKNVPTYTVRSIFSKSTLLCSD